ncbi:hypothetical protein Lal_00011199 [Lupinus albus]|uniref:Putative E3 ubiquitin-protein ligase MARCH n=1 Tax=Lupinus albus TaxID=3870 RepID=A0A6A4PH91_LUPAL|nr:putative E3 ubiquitin-protein ligase MARCH [Lupinus albus]KAF1888428.1 hypothetical protein Lal_00011199 [Lupinus albus]
MSSNIQIQMMSHVDLEQQHSMTETDISLCFSDADNDDDGCSCYSQFYSTNGGSYDDEYTSSSVSDIEVGYVDNDSRRVSSVTDCCVEMKECRICQMGLESDSDECGVPIELGCSCKGDLAFSHKNCAEAWFKIKGNWTCEICHCVAHNICGENSETRESLSDNNNNVTNEASTITTPSAPSSETTRFWHAQRFLNFLLASMVFAFVISWLFHFNLPQ